MTDAVLPNFLATVVLVSVSGVLSPGPLFIVSITRAIKSSGLSGFECAVGHTLVEFPLVIGLGLGSLAWLQGNPAALRLIGLIGGIVLLFFGLLQVYKARVMRQSDPTNHVMNESGLYTSSRSGVTLGVLFTGLNPFFLVWWLSVGWSLIVQALVIGAIGGVLLMFLAHIWMDYAWLGGAGIVASRGGLRLGRWYRILLLVFGVAMIYFGATFIGSSVS